LRILHFNLDTKFRGGQRQTLLLHQGLLKRGFDSQLLVHSKGLLHATCQRHQTPAVVPIRASQWGPPWLKRLVTVRYVKQAIVQINPDVLHFHEPGSLYYGGFFKRCKSVQTRRVSMPIKDISIRHKYKVIDVHVGVSAHVSQHLSEKGLKRVHTVHSSIDLTRFQNVVPTPLKDKRGFNFLYLGAFTQMKGIDVLLRAFTGLLKMHQDVALHMVGDGEEFEACQNLCQALGIQQHVRFYGQVPDPESYYPEADAVVVPSRRGEGSNGVIKEAMASGKPVIASDFESNLELITADLSGVFFKNEDSADLQTKMEQVLCGKIQLDAHAIRREAERFADDHMVDAYVRIYQQEFGEPQNLRVSA